MREQITALVKEQAEYIVRAESGIPENKKAEAIEAVTGSMMDGFREYVTPENVSSLGALIGSNISGTDFEATSILQSLSDNVSAALMSGAGVNDEVAGKVASDVIPAVMSRFSEKVKESGKSEFDIRSFVKKLMGDDKPADKDEIMDMIRDLLGN